MNVRIHIMPRAIPVSLALLFCAGFSVLAAHKYVAEQVTFPFKLYTDCGAEIPQPYVPSGWMGRTEGIEYDDCCDENPHSGESCIKFTLNPGGEWAGIVWQNPPEDWGDIEGGFNLTGAKAVTFWARGESGGEAVEFSLGVLGKDKPYPDSGSAKIPQVTLKKEWKQYTIPLSGKNLTCIKTGFSWSVKGKKKDPVIIYLDDIQYE